ncbi:hypothetical protein AV521_18545 [Streptomyces sp. IMTB 2501]|uniref:hypothetical protein n=1 Tax=Streptomyces sp. IMTB 2501 TaxID=1776340 RepID=UPI00096EA3B3|nr:hypothetical protein [Streptomyces sp. IMTB 2501]OLZ69508.1 hypothetical protein AV521_18545 [Streptomyces sp. IMTB 2501]
MSLETAVQMLLDAGYPVEDASQEVARIRAKAEQDAAMRITEAAPGRERGGEGSGNQARGDAERLA